MQIEYNLIRSKKRKTISFIISLDGELRVIVPIKVSNKYIKKIIEEKKDWIIKTKQRLEKITKPIKKEFISGEFFLYLGENYSLTLSSECKNKLIFKENQFILGTKYQSKAKDIFKKWYIQKAKEILEPEAIKVAKEMKVNFKEFKIRNMKRRWGSCTSCGNIILNYNLIKAPLEVSHYIIVHELAHLIEFNHSYKFWDIVKIYSKEYKKHKQWLENNIPLILF